MVSLEGRPLFDFESREETLSEREREGEEARTPESDAFSLRRLSSARGERGGAKERKK
jgi:hypothetical protein